MKYDLIISNPPYGAPGNGITKNIVENVDYGAFVNLLPCNDYRRYNKGFKLYQFVDLNTIRPIMKGFKDAAVTTTLCRVMKERQCSRTQSEFEIENYIDKSLKKYFYENVRREHYAIDNGKYPCKFEEVKNRVTPQNTFIVHSRDMNHGYIPKSGTAISVKWNINKELDIDYIHEHHWNGGRQSTYAYIIFKTEKERDNFTKFMLSDGWEFMRKVMKALGVDSSIAFSKWMPKVDWSKPQTVESILKDYGYTEQEISEVMEDLKQFKGIDQSCTSEDEFEIENYIDESLKKYFYETRKRSHYAFEKTECGKHPEKWIPGKTFVIGTRDMTNRHMPYGRNCSSYKWNIEHSINWHYFVEHHNNPRATRKGVYEVSFYAVTFNTENEFDNFTNFVYSKDGFRFMSKIFTAVNIDGFIALNKVFPKVDWTKPQTVQSILKDYGYTEQEISEVIEDLKKFRGFDQSYISEEEFEIENYTDKSLKKYFYGNRQKSHYAIDTNFAYLRIDRAETLTPETSFIIGVRDIGHGHMPYSRTNMQYKWNVEKSVDAAYLIANQGKHRSNKYDKEAINGLTVNSIEFKTPKEKENFSNFVYSEEGFRFISKVFTAVNCDGLVKEGKVFPKVDWTKPQTVQSILKDYGYTKPEIDEVMDDLKNFRGMDNE